MKVPSKRVRADRHLNERLRDTKKAAPLIGYMRVSKADGSQVLDLQRDALLAAGVGERNLYSDTAKLDERPGLGSCLQALREGDTLVIWKLDRLGRNLRHLVNVVHDLTNRGVGLRVLTGRARRSTRRLRPENSSSASSPRSRSSNANSLRSAPARDWPLRARGGAWGVASQR